jgi:formamidopyrimidine-DNA glycosylase
MPELPEVETFRKYIEATCFDQNIVGILCADERLLKKDLEAFKEQLIGTSFTSSHRTGKYLFLETTGEATLVLHFGMTGRPAYFYGLEARPRFAHIVYQFENGYNFGFENRRKFGWNDLTTDIQTYEHNKGLNTDARSISFEDFQKAISKRKTYIKPVIMDQSVTAGIGNWMADDICYQAKIHPKKKVPDLSEEQLKKVFDAMKTVIEVAIKEEAVYKNFPKDFFIHIREEGAICHHTGAKIEKITVGGRTTYFSPVWQQL